MISLNEGALLSVDITGRGGKENEIRSILEGNYDRKNHPLFDLQSKDDTSNRVEIKKQQNTQWFDLKKYYNLSDEDKSITMLFVCYHKSRGIEIVASCSLGEFLEFVVDNPIYREGGWQASIIRSAYEISLVAPKMQTKAHLSVRDFINDKESPTIIHFNKQKED